MLWGIDISRYQGDMDLHRVRREGYDFVIIKATEGGGWTDPNFARNLDLARAASLVHAAYHYQRAGVDVGVQAAHIARTVPRDCPVILDVEDGGGDVDLTRELTRRLQGEGFRLPLLYLPEWYWRQLGRPNLGGLPPLWYSRYPNNRAGGAADVYARNRAWLDGLWSGYGGLSVEVLQFSDQGSVAGRTPVDLNAYRGTREQLAALFGGTGTPAPTPEDDLQPDERDALFAIQAELLGPRGPQGQIQGWGTALGPRTVVAMMVEMFNTWQAARRPPGVEWDVWPIDALFDLNAAAFRTEGSVVALNATAGKLAELLATDRGLDPEAIRAAVHDAVATALRESTVNVEIRGNVTRAEGTGDQGVTSVATERARMEG